MPVASTISITVGGVNVTDKVLFRTARFDAQSGGGVGTFSFTVKDTAQTQNFVTGQEVVLTIDGKRYFGGYLMQIAHTFAFPVVDTATPGDVTARQFVLSGVNYNALFDRLVVRNTADYLHFLPLYPGTTPAGELVTELATNFLDIPAGFDTSLNVDPIGPALPPEHIPESNQFAWVRGGEQGVKWRDEMNWVSLFNSAIYYIDADKNLHYHAPEGVFSRWGFSDRPNRGSVLSTQTEWNGATYGFRELDTSEDISNIINDVFVWGGSPFVASTDPVAGGIVFARAQNAESIALYGRWQAAEVRWNELGIQEKVDALAESIVRDTGSTGAGDGVIRNRSLPDWTVSLVWFGHDVPTMQNAVKDHLTPGHVVTIILYVHGVDLTHPLILQLPLRRVSITFPSLPPHPAGQKLTYARFDGQFGLSLSDPFNLWEAILNRRARTEKMVSGAGSPTDTGGPGALWQGAPDEAADGTRKLFTLSSGGTPIMYAAGTVEIFLNGLRLRQGADYQEDANAGTITIFVAPPAGSTFWVTVRLAG